MCFFLKDESTTGGVDSLQNDIANDWQGIDQQQQISDELFLLSDYWPETNFISTVRPPTDQHNVSTVLEPHVLTNNVDVTVDSSTQMPINKLPLASVSAPQNESTQILPLTGEQVLHFINNNGVVSIDMEFLQSLYLFVHSRLMLFSQRNAIPFSNVDEFVDYYFHLIISGDYDLLRLLV